MKSSISIRESRQGEQALKFLKIALGAICLAVVISLLGFVLINSQFKKLISMQASYAEKLDSQQLYYNEKIESLNRKIDAQAAGINSEEIVRLLKNLQPRKKENYTPSNELRHHEIINQYFEENE